MSDSLTFFVPEQYQATIWSDGVIRFDGQAGPRLGAWQARVPASWYPRLNALVADLPKPTRTSTDETVLLTVTTGTRTRAYRLGRELTADAPWRLMTSFQGVLALANFLPLDTTGQMDMSRWAESSRVRLAQTRVFAEGLACASGLLVLAGSLASPSTSPTLEKNYVRARASLEKEGAFVLLGDAFLLTRHLFFEAPSAAASVLTGSNTNGRTAWKRPEGGDWTTLNLG
jgi:hypothetical protein